MVAYPFCVLSMNDSYVLEFFPPMASTMSSVILMGVAACFGSSPNTYPKSTWTRYPDLVTSIFSRCLSPSPMVNASRQAPAEDEIILSRSVFVFNSGQLVMIKLSRVEVFRMSYSVVASGIISTIPTVNDSGNTL